MYHGFGRRKILSVKEETRQTDVKPKILFSVEKFLDASHPEWGCSVHEYGIVGSLTSSNMGLASTFYYDEFLQAQPDQDVDAALVKKCEQSRPDMVLATWIIQNGERNVKPETYGHIRDELKIPVAAYWSESAPDVVRHADIFAPCVTANVFIETKDEWRRHAQHPEKCVRLFEPRDAALFNSADQEPRDIALSFLGTSFGRMDRALNLGFLRGRGVGVHETHGQRFNRMAPADYASLLKRSLVTINFSSAVTFQHMTGRTVEATMAGAMLLESENGETPELLDPYADYVPFKESFHYAGAGQIGFQDGDLAEKALHYAYQKPEEARRIAESGKRKVMERCDGREFWAKLFEIVRVKR